MLSHRQPRLRDNPFLGRVRMSTTVKTAAAVSVAVIVVAGAAYLWRSNSRATTQPLHGPTFSSATTNPAVAADVSQRLSSLSPPKDEDADEAEREEEEGR